MRDLAVRSPERTVLSALAIVKGTSLAPPAGVILAVRNAAAIAARNADSLVVDFEHQRVFRGTDRVEMACSPERTQIFAVASAICCGFGGRVRRDALIDMLWGEDPEGGILWAENALAVRLSKARGFFRWAGLRVTTRYGGTIEVSGVEPCRAGPWPSFRIGNHKVHPVGALA